MRFRLLLFNDYLDKTYVLSWHCCIALADLGENTNARMVALGGPPILKTSFQQLIDQFPVVLSDFIVYV